PGLVAVAVAPGDRADAGGGGLHLARVAQQPEQQVERVRAEVAEAADPGDLRVGHPAPLGVEPALERAGVAVGRPDAGDRPEAAARDLLAQEAVDREAALEVAGLEVYPRPLDRLGHRVGVARRDRQRLLHEEVLLRRGRRRDEFLVAVGLGADDHGGDRAVAPDRLWVAGLEPERLRVAPGARRVVVPDRGHPNVVARLQPLDEVGRVDVRAADERDLGRGAWAVGRRARGA